jgi:hypothetical protein
MIYREGCNMLRAICRSYLDIVAALKETTCDDES